MAHPPNWVYRFGIAAIPFILAGCVMDGPFVDRDIDRLVSSDSTTAWSQGGGPAPVTPLAIPAAAASATGDPSVNLATGDPSVNLATGDAEENDTLTGSPRETLSLTRCIDVALSASPRTRGSWESARAAAAQVGIADSEYMPDIGLRGDFGPQRQQVLPAIVNNVSGNAIIGMSWVLLDFGRRDADAARARAQLTAANFAFNREMQRLVFDVQRAYFVLDAKISLREAARENVATARKQLDATDDRMTVGLATRPEVLQARQQYMQSLYALEEAKAEVYVAQAQLAVAMGIPAQSSPEIVRLADLPLPSTITDGVEVAIQSALAQRPDIASALGEVRSKEQMVKRAEADFLPIINFEGSAGVTGGNFNYTQPGFSGSGAAAYGLYSAQVTADWLLFDGYERANRLRQARSEVRAAEARLEQLRLETTGQVWSSYFDFFSAQKQYEAGVALLTASQDSYDSVYQNYLNGLATINDLLLAESFLFDARFELIKSRADLLTASATFIYALGS
ncbi:MAG: TolC family protein [Planctomycetes bacterium]|nr:TolC family protein [Planctomycetota bacterium]